MTDFLAFCKKVGLYPTEELEEAFHSYNSSVIGIDEAGNPDSFPDPNETAHNEKLERLQHRNEQIEFSYSSEMKESHALWQEAHTSREHEIVGFGRVWCPIYEKVRPEWLCASEHGDYHEVLDEDWSDHDE